MATHTVTSSRSFLISLSILASQLLASCAPSSSLPSSEAAIATAFPPRAAASATSFQATIPVVARTAPLAPAATWTPLPTVSHSERASFTTHLLDTNAGCQLPCWWGITPGLTPWTEASQFLTTFANEVKFLGEGTVTIDSVPSPVQEYALHFPISEEPDEGGIGISVRDGFVTGILVTPETTRTAFQLPRLLADYGVPTSVMIRTWPGPTPFGLPFTLVLLYPDSRFLAVYEFEGKLEGDQVLGCPGNAGPDLYIWAPDETQLWVSQDRIDSFALGQEPRHSVLPIEEVTQWAIKDFFSAFTSLHPGTCISTPTNLW